MDKMSAYFFEIINKTITVGITDDLFSNTEKVQIIDDYSEWINKNNDEMATEYVICTCYMHFVPSLSITNTPNIRCIHACMSETSHENDSDNDKNREENKKSHSAFNLCCIS